MTGRNEKIALIVRVKNEAHIEEFVRYYLTEGIDKIFIFDDLSDGKYKKILDSLHKSSLPVLVIRRKLVPNPNQAQIVRQVYHRRIKKNFDWVMYVDADEYIVPKKEATSTIRKELATTFSKADCVLVPWVMIAYNGLEKDPKSILKTNIWRWDHDKKHPAPTGTSRKFRCRYDAIEVKSIWRTSKFNLDGVHVPRSIGDSLHVVVDSVTGLECALKPLRANLRESNVRSGHLLCYHYRIASKQHAKRRLRTSSLRNYRAIQSIKEITDTDYPEVRDTTLRDRKQMEEHKPSRTKSYNTSSASQT